MGCLRNPWVRSLALCNLNALLERQTLAQERTAAAAAQQARIANFESSQRMIDDGLALMRGDRNLAGQVRQPQQKSPYLKLKDKQQSIFQKEKRTNTQSVWLYH